MAREKPCLRSNRNLAQPAGAVHPDRRARARALKRQPVRAGKMPVLREEIADRVSPPEDCLPVKTPKSEAHGPIIAQNRKAWHDYFIEQKFEAGLALEGWEVKSLRAGRAQLKEGYVVIDRGEVYLIGAHISPLASASTHVAANPTRARKLLLHREEIRKLIGAVERRGYTLVPLALYWKNGRAKLEFGLGRGKKAYDKRADIKKREAEREQRRALLGGGKGR
jgi:SsrA-binding protein